MAFLERTDNRKLLYGQLATTLLWAAVTGFGIYLSPSRHGHGTHQQLGLPPCPSVLIFDKPCPGCGLTTSWTATIHGHFVEAFRAHPLGPPLYLLFTFFAILNLWGFFRGIRVDTGGRKWTLGIIAGGVIFFGFGMARFFWTSHYSSPDEMKNFVRKYSKP